jgi:hypothetical protein
VLVSFASRSPCSVEYVHSLQAHLSSNQSRTTHLDAWTSVFPDTNSISAVLFNLSCRALDTSSFGLRIPTHHVNTENVVYMVQCCRVLSSCYSSRLAFVHILHQWLESKMHDVVMLKGRAEEKGFDITPIGYSLDAA